ncbi:Serine carboxypeptidase-like 18 [Camellia lanceoleosa]|uniref:Serine carboxypeptidase-like 18 n=1 Tax=Camellia lanceoleosa TaxID=1840588 RepID=A0ACC0IN80_9ERIC|nr:Serine carboxypeptidase-like 18 [Camellia lanceoleosa]
MSLSNRIVHKPLSGGILASLLTVRYGLYIHYFLLLLLLSAQAVVGGHIVKYLPGYDGELPFKLETGYIRVNESELFYYFIESQGNPQEDPIFLWLTGGPGCSSFCGLVYEIGPMEFVIQNYTGGLPKLRYYPYAWTKWFDEHPQYLAVQLFVGGDSYSGITVPLVTKKIVDGNKDGVKPFMNLKGYLLGSPRTDSVIDENSKVVFAHRMTLISDEIYENAKKGCSENYVNVDPANTACMVALGNIKTCIKDLFRNDILEPKCVFATPDPGEEQVICKIYFFCNCKSKTQAVLGGHIVKYLPGYDGELPFKLETGYIRVNESELFYYFIESQGNPQEDPIFLWLSGGPGCTSFFGLVYEIGPMEFVIQNYTGGLPKLRYYPHAWTKSASIIFLDAPVGTGFSYSRTADGWPTSDSKSAEQSYQFLRKWFDEHPQYLAVQLFVGGDSYSGIPVPVITKKIVDGNKDGVKPFMNLKGYLLGSPRTDSVIDENSKVIFAHRMALISDEIYENAKKGCNENYVNVDPANTACMVALGNIKMCIKDLFRNDILEPKCVFTTPDPGEEPAARRSLEEGPSDFLLSPPMIPNLWCRNFNYALSYIWANDDTVQEALHVRKGSVLNWKRCNKSISYTKDILTVVPVHEELKELGLEVLVEIGDRDMVVPFVGTVKWIKALNLTVVNDWRPWFVDGQVAGYTVKYSEHGYRLTYATVKLSMIGGHGSSTVKLQHTQ